MFVIEYSFCQYYLLAFFGALVALCFAALFRNVTKGANKPIPQLEPSVKPRLPPSFEWFIAAEKLLALPPCKAELAPHLRPPATGILNWLNRVELYERLKLCIEQAQAGIRHAETYAQAAKQFGDKGCANYAERYADQADDLIIRAFALRQYEDEDRDRFLFIDIPKETDFLAELLAADAQLKGLNLVTPQRRAVKRALLEYTLAGLNAPALTRETPSAASSTFSSPDFEITTPAQQKLADLDVNVMEFDQATFTPRRFVGAAKLVATRDIPSLEI